MKNITLLLLIWLFTACNHGAKTESGNPEAIQKVEITITGMTCTGCEQTVTKGALALDGVKEAKASYKDGKAWVTYEDGKVTPEAITASIENTGYKVTAVTPVN
jgi:copper chaperone CopZ